MYFCNLCSLCSEVCSDNIPVWLKFNKLYQLRICTDNSCLQLNVHIVNNFHYISTYLLSISPIVFQFIQCYVWWVFLELQNQTKITSCRNQGSRQSKNRTPIVVSSDFYHAWHMTCVNLLEKTRPTCLPEFGKY